MCWLIPISLRLYSLMILFTSGILLIRSQTWSFSRLSSPFHDALPRHPGQSESNPASRVNLPKKIELRNRIDGNIYPCTNGVVKFILIYIIADE